MAIKYAWSPEVRGDSHWALKPWHQLGMEVFETVAAIPADYVLVVSHFAPWWEPLRSWISEGRPWIEIEYGYWGQQDSKGRRATRRVTYCGHHNTNIGSRPWSRVQLFSKPLIQDWQQRRGDYVIAVMPQSNVLTERTGQHIDDWRAQLQSKIQQYWPGKILWRVKGGDKRLRWDRYCQELAHAHAVVGERTMACVEAVMMGVPAYTVDVSMVTPLMGNIDNLANPQRPDRSDWWDHVCWSQFQPEEFSTAAPAMLTEFYQITGMAENVDRYRPADLPDHSSELLPAHESTGFDQIPDQTQSD